MYRRQNLPRRKSQLGLLFVGNRRALFGKPWSYLDWFRSGEPGAVFEADDPALGGPVTAYQDSAGTTAVYAPGQGSVDPPVGKLIDKSGRGNHLVQATAASRMVLSQRYNSLLSTEDIGSAVWTKTRASAASATELREDATAANTHILVTAATVLTANISFKFSAEVKPNGRTIIGVSNSANGTQRGEFTLTGLGSAAVAGSFIGTNASVSGLTINLLADGYYAVSGTILSGTTAALAVYLQAAAGSITYDGNGTAGVFVRKFDLRTSADAALSIPAYQRVTDASNYDTAGFPRTWRADGGDDSIACATGGGASTAAFIMMGFAATAAGAAQTLWSDRTGNTGLKLEVSAGNAITWSGGNGASINTVTGNAVTLGQTYIVTALYEGGVLSVQLNDAAPVTGACVLSAGTAGFTIAKDNSAASGYFKGRIGTVFYRKDNPVTASSIARAKRYIANQLKVTAL